MIDDHMQGITPTRPAKPKDANAPVVLEVRALAKSFFLREGLFGKREFKAVRDVNFRLRRGHTLGVVGESGSGKTTVGLLLMRLVEASAGSVRFAGNDLFSLPERQMIAFRKRIQLIFQNPYASLNPRFTVGRILIEPMKIHGIGKGDDERFDRAIALLKRVGLPSDAIYRYPHEFSGGQRQRIAIARALALNPKVVVADESVSALDVSIQAQIVNLMLDLQRELGVAFLFISHDMAVVERISHRVAVMFLGQIVEIGPRRAIFENPQHAYTKKLMAAVPIADPARRHLKRTLLGGEIPSPIRAVGDEPAVQPLVEVGPGHFVARHAIANLY